MARLIDRIIETETRLEAWCIAELRVITPDGRISEQSVADILGVDIRTLQNNRGEGKSPPFYNQPVGRNRISYRLKDVARWIEEQREEPARYVNTE